MDIERTILGEQKNNEVYLVKKLLSFLQEGFQNPIKIIEYLRSRTKCSDDYCRRGCEELISYFSGQRPWDGLSNFFEWCWQWYPRYRYEEPINAVFTLPRVAQFLALEMRMEDSNISDTFKMEFRGKLRLKRDIPVPPCLWKDERSVCIGKRILNHQMCCDFYLTHPFPSVVAEVKVAVPQTTNKTFHGFVDDLNKCREWLKEDANPFIEAKFGIKRFEYALAILVDLTEGEEYRELWESHINEEDYYREGIFVWLISPNL